MIHVYSMIKHGNILISKHFGIGEFACKDKSDEILIDEKLVDLLEQCREYFDAPVHILSGYRTPSYNSKLKGASPVSQHLYGRAADIWVEGRSHDEVWEWANAHNLKGGVGRYDTFTHIDVRVTGPKRWDERKKS